MAYTEAMKLQPKKTLAELFKAAREARELTQRELSEKLNYSHITIANVERGHIKEPREYYLAMQHLLTKEEREEFKFMIITLELEKWHETL